MAEKYDLGSIPLIVSALAGLAGKQPDVLPDQRKGLAGLVSQPKRDATTGEVKKTFWDKPGGSILGSLLGTLAMSGLGAGIGAIASPGHAGLGATRGAAYGAGTGLMEDLGLRKAAMGGEANQQKLDLENTKTRALIGEWGNKARYRDAMAKLGYAKFNLDEAKYGRYAEDVETFAKSWYQANPDGTQEQFTAALNFKFPEMFVGKDPEKTNITAAPVVGTPAKQGWFGTSVGATPAKPGMYNQQQIPNKLPGETREAYQQRTGLKVE